MTFSIAELKKVKEHMTRLEHQQQQNIFIDPVNYTIEIKSGDKMLRRYTPDNAPTVRRFHEDKTSLHKLIMGPRGSAKSSGSIADIIFKTYNNPPCIDGVKRARFLIGRETYGELRTTTIETFMHWFGFDELGWKINWQPPIAASLEYFDGEALTQLELFFISFDNAAAAKKALSLELTGAYFNEGSQIAKAAIDATVGSIGRYPAMADKVQGQSYWHGIIIDTNAFEEFHPLYEIFVKHPAPRHTFFLQPGGMNETAPGVFEVNPTAENLVNLPPDYYMNMSLGKTKSFVRSQICNQFVVHEEGKPVHAEYDPVRNSANDIEIDNNYPIWLTHDYGGTNATLITQYINGQLCAIKELIGFREGLTEFQSTVVKEWLRCNAGNTVIELSVGDLSNAYSNGTGEYSNDTVSTALGINTVGSITNNPKARIDAVDRLILRRRGDGQTGLLVSRAGCPVLHAGLSGKYHFKTVRVGGEEKIVEQPVKNDYSHPADCLQYAALEARRTDQEGLQKADVSDELINNSWGITI